MSITIASEGCAACRSGWVSPVRFAWRLFVTSGTIALLFLLPVVYPLLDGIYLLGIAAVAALLVYEHWIVRPDDLTRVNVAFFNVNAVISVGLFVIGSLDLLL